MARPSRRSDVYVGATFLALLLALGLGQRLLESSAAAEAQSAVQAPLFEVDPLWPKPLPHHWLLGSVTGVAVDAQDHIWVVHRGYDSKTVRTDQLSSQHRLIARQILIHVRFHGRAAELVHFQSRALG